MILIVLDCNAQNDYNESYYKKLLVELEENDRIADVELFKKTYKGGTIKTVFVKAKFKEDNSNRYWLVGRCQGFYKNGQLAHQSLYDSQGTFIGDKYIHYIKNGQKKYEIEFISKPDDYYVEKYKGAFFNSPKIGNVRFYSVGGRLKVEYGLKYDSDSGILKLHGVRKNYKYPKNRCKVVESEYLMGKRISKRKYFLN